MCLVIYQRSSGLMGKKINVKDSTNPIKPEDLEIDKGAD